MKKLYFGIGILAVLILASGIYAVNYGQLDSIMSNSAVITDDTISTIGSDIASEFKSSENTLAEDMITQQNSNILPDKDNEFKYEKYVYHVDEKGNKYVTFHYTDDMTDEERQEMQEAEKSWTDELLSKKQPLYSVVTPTKYDDNGNIIEESKTTHIYHHDELIISNEHLKEMEAI